MNQWETPLSGVTRPERASVFFDISESMTITIFLVFLQIFREHSLEGSSLALLSESHLTGILGLKLGPAMRLLKAIRAL